MFIIKVNIHFRNLGPTLLVPYKLQVVQILPVFHKKSKNYAFFKQRPTRVTKLKIRVSFKKFEPKRMLLEKLDKQVEYTEESSGF